MGKKYRDTGLKLLPEENKKPSWREPGQRIRMVGVVMIDRSVFAKTPEEKLRLKNAKLKGKSE